eukprot:scaffold7742_cov59-Phaeocystis_antarctica.AAC.3
MEQMPSYAAALAAAETEEKAKTHLRSAPNAFPADSTRAETAKASSQLRESMSPSVQRATDLVSLETLLTSYVITAAVLVLQATRPRFFPKHLPTSRLDACYNPLVRRCRLYPVLPRPLLTYIPTPVEMFLLVAPNCSRRALALDNLRTASLL